MKAKKQEIAGQNLLYRQALTPSKADIAVAKKLLFRFRSKTRREFMVAKLVHMISLLKG